MKTSWHFSYNVTAFWGVGWSRIGIEENRVGTTVRFLWRPPTSADMISLLPLSTGHPPILHVSVQKLHKVASAFSSHSVDWANPCLLVFCWQGWFCDRISSKHLASWTLELDFKNVFSPLPLVGCPGFLCSPGGQIVFFIFNLVNACPRCRDSQRRTLSSLERCRPRESILLLLDPDPWSGLY